MTTFPSYIAEDKGQTDFGGQLKQKQRIAANRLLAQVRKEMAREYVEGSTDEPVEPVERVHNIMALMLGALNDDLFFWRPPRKARDHAVEIKMSNTCGAKTFERVEEEEAREARARALAPAPGPWNAHAAGTSSANQTASICSAPPGHAAAKTQETGKAAADRPLPRPLTGFLEALPPGGLPPAGEPRSFAPAQPLSTRVPALQDWNEKQRDKVEEVTPSSPTDDRAPPFLLA